MIDNKEDKTPVAQNVVTMCTKCKMQLDHVVLFHDKEGIVEKVKCNTCGSEHKYRPEREKSPKKAAKTSKGGRRSKKLDLTMDFETLTEKFKGKKPVHYTMSGSFKADDMIEHKTFGLGIVISASNEKMEVVFSDRPRTLVYNW
ncbi:MAG: hypothetical protein JW928_01485 [Candidatus Aureabacteria bacterium]|nr:hypothetical protein [Candidatus Auribacterota bacterium]